jgi:hypothetical protein
VPPRVQNWLWEQPTASRRPYYKTNAYVCWNAAWFKPAKDTDWSHALVMGRGYYTQSAYSYNFANRAGLTVLVVARWAGQQGTQNWQHVIAKGLDSYQGGYTAGSGWSMTISEKGAIGANAGHYVRAVWVQRVLDSPRVSPTLTRACSLSHAVLHALRVRSCASEAIGHE